MGTPLINAELGKYELVERLAIGGMGELFLARERGLAGFDRTVVIKQLLPDLANKPEQVGMFISEARIWAHLQHPNIVQVLEFGQEGTRYFLAMEYVAGTDLECLMSRLSDLGIKLDFATAIHVVLNLARALDFAHNAKDSEGRPLGIVHRDVSPHNALLSLAGDVKLTDFGIAKSSQRFRKTSTGMVMGKLGYMAPEQMRAEVVDARADVYSLGVVLWELTVGRRLKAAGASLMEAVSQEPIPRPSSILSDYPPRLEEIVMSTLEKDVNRRLPSAAALAAALKAFVVESGLSSDADRLSEIVRRCAPEALRAVEGRDSTDALTTAREGTKRRAARPLEVAPVAAADAVKAVTTARVTKGRARLGVFVALSLTLALFTAAAWRLSRSENLPSTRAVEPAVAPKIVTAATTQVATPPTVERPPVVEPKLALPKLKKKTGVVAAPANKLPATAPPTAPHQQHEFLPL